jgi:two-component sensor histidine kinase
MRQHLRGMQNLARIYIDIPAVRPGTAGAYLLAFLSAVVATVVRLGIHPYVVGVPFITFFPAVIMVTLISGLGAGLFCVVLSSAAAWFFKLPPRPADMVDLLLFILVAVSIVIFIAAMRLAFEGYRELSLKLQQQSVALRESEERLQTVVAELQHRTRNLISVVGTMAKATLRASRTFDDFSSTFQDRLEVLGRAQGLLFRAKEGGRVTFDELINTELAAQSVRTGEHGSVTLDGPKGIPLRSRTVQSLAMALHELMTNAAKYGALTQPNARLAIRWWQETLGRGQPWLHLDWKESGVEMPPLGAKPQGSGQGRELIERVLPYQFDAQRPSPWKRMASIAPFCFPPLSCTKEYRAGGMTCAVRALHCICLVTCSGFNEPPIAHGFPKSRLSLRKLPVNLARSTRWR